MKSHLLWIIQRPLVLVLEKVMKSWSLSFLFMQIVVSDTPIIYPFSLLYPMSSTLFFSWKSQPAQPFLAGTVPCHFVTLLCYSFRSAVSAFLDGGVRPVIWIITEEYFFSFLFSVHLPIISNVWFDFFDYCWGLKMTFLMELSIVIPRSCSWVTVPINLQVKLECLNNHVLKLQD